MHCAIVPQRTQTQAPLGDPKLGILWPDNLKCHGCPVVETHGVQQLFPCLCKFQGTNILLNSYNYNKLDSTNIMQHLPGFTQTNICYRYRCYVWDPSLCIRKGGRNVSKTDPQDLEKVCQKEANTESPNKFAASHKSRPAKHPCGLRQSQVPSREIQLAQCQSYNLIVSLIVSPRVGRHLPNTVQCTGST